MAAIVSKSLQIPCYVAALFLHLQKLQIAPPKDIVKMRSHLFQEGCEIEAPTKVFSRRATKSPTLVKLLQLGGKSMEESQEEVVPEESTESSQQSRESEEVIPKESIEARRLESEELVHEESTESPQESRESEEEVPKESTEPRESEEVVPKESTEPPRLESPKSLPASQIREENNGQGFLAMLLSDLEPEAFASILRKSKKVILFHISFSILTTQGLLISITNVNCKLMHYISHVTIMS